MASAFQKPCSKTKLATHLFGIPKYWLGVWQSESVLFPVWPQGWGRRGVVRRAKPSVPKHYPTLVQVSQNRAGTCPGRDSAADGSPGKPWPWLPGAVVTLTSICWTFDLSQDGSLQGQSKKHSGSLHGCAPTSRCGFI